ncbi:MAG: 50S ribosomal protein L4 [Candidatus Tectomicrobia bacterium]|nr:50S ribosomal protein L4 [Candidatus Tectomicrobia bacterium]
MELDVIDRQGTIVEKVAVADNAFGAEVKPHLFHQVVRMQLANRRRGTASTKTRGEVSGGGRKPWRQKGTGRARQGSTRSPLWRGGGVALGPKPRDYAYQLPKKVRRAALCSALSMKTQEGLLKVIDRLDIPAPKTRQMVGFLKDLGVEKAAIILLADDNPNVQLAARNLPAVKVLRVEGLNIYDLLAHDYLICTRETLTKLQERVAS